MKGKCVKVVATFVAFGALVAVSPADAQPVKKTEQLQLIQDNAQSKVNGGVEIFRFDTFGDEQFWGGKLKLHRAIAGDKLGGVGTGLTPKTALDLGLKVDVDALPEALVQRLRANTGRPDRSGDYGGSSEAECSGRGERLLLRGSAVVGGYHLCLVPFYRR